MCVSICMYVCGYILVLYMCTCICIYRCLCVNVYVYMCVYMYVYICMCIYVHMCMYVWAYNIHIKPIIIVLYSTLIHQQ